MDEMNRKMMKKAIKKSTGSDDEKRLLMSFINMNSVVTNIERIADHATNIAEAAIYSIEGKDVVSQKLVKLRFYFVTVAFQELWVSWHTLRVFPGRSNYR